MGNPPASVLNRQVSILTCACGYRGRLLFTRGTGMPHLVKVRIRERNLDSGSGWLTTDSPPLLHQGAFQAPWDSGFTTGESS